MIGYTKPLYILPFDHKTSFVKKLFGFDYYNLTPEQREKVIETRQLIYEGFIDAIKNGIAKEDGAILTDEEFGDFVLRDAKENGYITMLTTEKSGQEELQFEYGDDFSKHIEKYQPQFAKALVRYNPDEDKERNQRQLATLKKLSDYSHEKGYTFLVEPLVPATEAQLQAFGNDQELFDRKLRPSLTGTMIEEFHTAGVEPDVWKLEGFDTADAYKYVVTKAREGDRSDVSVVVLGRASSNAVVEKWLTEGAKVDGVIGFAVGRTVFYEPLEKLYKQEQSREETVKEISQNFMHFYEVFVNAKKKDE